MTRIVMDLKKNSMKIDLDSITRIVTDIFCHNDKNCHGLQQKKNSMKIDLDNITRIVIDFSVTMTIIVNDILCHVKMTRIVSDIYCQNQLIDKNCHPFSDYQ